MSVERGVAESCLGDLEELSNDIDSLSVYAIRPDHLRNWVFKLRSTVRALKRIFDKKGSFQSVKGFDASVPDGDFEGGTAADSMSFDAPSKPTSLASTTSIAPVVSGSLHLMLDALMSSVAADWATCFLYSQRNEELVLTCCVGKRFDKPGSLRLSATSGIESHVLQTGVAINVAHTYTEDEFTGAQDRKQQGSARTRSEFVFPLTKPGSAAHCMGVLQLCNKSGGTGFFTEQDEGKVAQCASLISAILAKYTTDLANPLLFDAQLMQPFQRQEVDRLPPLGPVLPQQAEAPTLVFRTARGGHIKRADVIREATKLPVMPTITEAMSYITRVNEAWRNAVLLNIELEKEIARLHEALKTGKREQARLQAAVADLRRQLESQDTSAIKRRHSSLFVPHPPAPPPH